MGGAEVLETLPRGTQRGCSSSWTQPVCSRGEIQTISRVLTPFSNDSTFLIMKDTSSQPLTPRHKLLLPKFDKHTQNLFLKLWGGAPRRTLSKVTDPGRGGDKRQARIFQTSEPMPFSLTFLEELKVSSNSRRSMTWIKGILISLHALWKIKLTFCFPGSGWFL